MNHKPAPKIPSPRPIGLVEHPACETPSAGVCRTPSSPKHQTIFRSSVSDKHESEAYNQH